MEIYHIYFLSIPGHWQKTPDWTFILCVGCAAIDGLAGLACYQTNPNTEDEIDINYSSHAGLEISLAYGIYCVDCLDSPDLQNAIDDG